MPKPAGPIKIVKPDEKKSLFLDRYTLLLALVCDSAGGGDSA